MQTYLIAKISGYVTEKTKHEISIGYINLSWFDTIWLKDVLIRDKYQDTLIYVKDIKADFDLWHIIEKKDPKLNFARVEGANVQLHRPKDAKYLNVDDWVTDSYAAFRNEDEKAAENVTIDTTSSVSNPFRVTNVNLIDSRFAYVDDTRDSIKDGMNYNHFELIDVNVKIRDLMVSEGIFTSTIDQLSCLDPASGLNVKRLSTQYYYSEDSMCFKNTNAFIGSSYISQDMCFYYHGSGELSDFNDKVDIKAKLVDTYLATEDIAQFDPSMLKYNDKYYFSGNFEGKVNNFDLRDFKVHFGKKSYLSGDFDFEGLPYFYETFIRANLTSSNVDPKDLRIYLSAEQYDVIKDMDELGFEGDFVGFSTNFVTTGQFFSPYGKIIADINIKFPYLSKLSYYTGEISVTDFDFGGFSGDPLLGKLSLSGKIDGSGFSKKSASFTLKAKMPKLEFAGYECREIEADGEFASELFDGKLSINDPNLKLISNGLIDTREKKDSIKLDVNLIKADLQALGLFDKNAVISSHFRVNMKGIQLDTIKGYTEILKTAAFIGNQSLYIDSIRVFSKKRNNQQELDVYSDLFSLNLFGSFKYSQVMNRSLNLLEEYKLLLLNKKDTLRVPNNIPSPFSLNYKLTLKNITPLLKLLGSDISISKGEFEGYFTGGAVSEFTMKAHTDFIQKGQNILYDNHLDIYSSIITDERPYAKTNIHLQSKKQNFLSLTQAENMDITFDWYDDKIDLSFYAKEQKKDNRVIFNSVITYHENQNIEARIKHADVKVFNTIWDIQSGNSVAYKNGNIIFDKVRSNSGDQLIKFEGKISKDPRDVFTLGIENLKLENLSALTKSNIKGELDAKVSLKDFYNKLTLESALSIELLEVNKFLVGTVASHMQWFADETRMNLNLSLNNKQKKVINIQGDYFPSHQDSINFKVDFNEAKLSIWQGFLLKYVTDLEGELNASAHLTGNLRNPLIAGKGKLKNGRLVMDYLKTEYRFNGDIELDNEKLGVKKFKIYDINDSEAVVTGGIFHNRLRDFLFNLNINFDDFRVLNTDKNDNKLYYGIINSSGEVNLIGNLDLLEITVKARTNKGTQFFIPLDVSSSYEQGDFIRFVKVNDYSSAQAKIDQIEKIDLKGINLNFEIDVTEDALCQIIFDRASGDILRIRGNGELQLSIDPEYEFNLIGDYRVSEGAYNFTLGNILINKEFQIQDNSVISWHGNPYQGTMDIEATYNQLASLSPLYSNNRSDSTLAKHPDVKKKYPTQVTLYLDGALTGPSIDFDIQINEYPRTITTDGGLLHSLETDIAAFKNRLANDEQELKKQVFSLILLRRFSPENTFDATGTLSSSVSELFSNQFSNWASQLDDNLEVSLDLTDLSSDALKTMQLRLGYTTLDGRLNISRAGGFTKNEYQSDFANIAGEWTVEYLLTENGKFKVKMYNRNNYSPLRIKGTNSITAGFSFQYLERFDKLKDIFSKP